jgi:NAD(P)-dependent dehydrogenase (short-subunit alcohol dehydrogenase family)
MLGPESILLSNRVAIVTGGAVGIGAATAQALARFGADVAVCDRDAENLEQCRTALSAIGRGALSGQLDARDTAAVGEFVARVVERFGRVDILVNNAGGGFRSALQDLSDNALAALVSENFNTVTNFVRTSAPHMKAGSSIINLTSIEAHRAAPGYAVYAAMKAAVANLTKSLALELGERLIRVNCVAPDVIPTPGIGGSVPVRTPLLRPGDVDDVAAAIVFLASDMAGFITGTTLHVDGGNLAASGWRRTATGYET